MSPPHLIISGAPASGKGTQCEYLVNDYNVVHLSTGDILRDAIKAETEIGLKAKEFVENGALVPDDIIIGVILDRLKQDDCVSQGWLLDGFPRTGEQAVALANNGVIADVFILLDVSDDLLLERVVGRRLDPETGKIYHLKYFPPPEDEEIQARLVHRADDTEEKFSVRIQGYHANLPAILSYFEDKLLKIPVTSPDQTPALIYETMKEGLTSRLTSSEAVEESTPPEEQAPEPELEGKTDEPELEGKTDEPEPEGKTDDEAKATEEPSADSSPEAVPPAPAAALPPVPPVQENRDSNMSKSRSGVCCMC